jgi:hypothetical protein
LDTFVHDDCPIPHTTTTAKCGWDRSTPISTTLYVSTVGTNAVSILAMMEYYHATGNDQYIKAAISIAQWIHGIQRDDGSFVQKVIMDPATNEDDDVTNSCQGQVSFALARLYHVLVDKNSHNLVQKKEEWLLEGARRAAAYIVASYCDMSDEDVPMMDEWVMNAIGELYSMLGDNIGTAMIDHAMRIVQLAAKSQTTYIGHGEDMDKLGIYNGDSSATVTAKVREGLCAVYSLALNMELVDDARTIERVTTLSQRYQLQSQYRPEQAMYMKDSHRVLGGFRGGVENWEMKTFDTLHNLNSILCMARLVKQMEVSWTE